MQSISAQRRVHGRQTVVTEGGVGRRTISTQGGVGGCCISKC